MKLLNRTCRYNYEVRCFGCSGRTIRVIPEEYPERIESFEELEEFTKNLVV